MSEGHKVHFNPGGDFDDPNLVPVSKETPIVIGGNEWLQCTHERARKLRKQGYTNVRTDHSLSYDTFRRR